MVPGEEPAWGNLSWRERFRTGVLIAGVAPTACSQMCLAGVPGACWGRADDVSPTRACAPALAAPSGGQAGTTRSQLNKWSPQSPTCPGCSAQAPRGAPAPHRRAVDHGQHQGQVRMLGVGKRSVPTSGLPALANPANPTLGTTQMCSLPDKSRDKFGYMDAVINLPGPCAICKARSADPGSLQNPSPRHSQAAQLLPWPEHGFQSRDCPLAAASGQGSPLVMLLQQPLPGPRKRRRFLQLGCGT